MFVVHVQTIEVRLLTNLLTIENGEVFFFVGKRSPTCLGSGSDSLHSCSGDQFARKEQHAHNVQLLQCSLAVQSYEYEAILVMRSVTH